MQYSDEQLESFLDSVGKLPTSNIANKVAFYADSVFRHEQRRLDTLISGNDLNLLKAAIRKGAISVKTARRIFNNPKIDSSCRVKSIDLTYKQGFTPIELYPFSKKGNSFDEYAICIGDPAHCPDAYLYFFKGHKVIAMQNFYDRFAQELEHYKDSDGKTIVYYGYQFAEGSDEWWFNYFFYKYDGDKLIPVLNELENGNTQNGFNSHILWLESTILSTHPLTMKMVYYDQFTSAPTDSPFVEGPRIVDDSTIVKYIWDEASKTLQGQYSESKISKAQILSYYLDNNELLFINSHYKTIKASLLDKNKRKLTLQYLNAIKSVMVNKK